MRKVCVLLAALFCSSLCAEQELFLPPTEGQFPEHLIINNRILLKINGKPISMMDVVKKMDLVFYQRYPELATSAAARYQFYSQAWRSFFLATVEDQLIVADAKEKQIEVTEGEVREELERLFGPDVVQNVDKMGFTLEEITELLKTDLIVRQMIGMMVRTKAISDVHPKQVRARYEEFIAKNPPQNKWIYQILSIRAADPEEELEIAEKAHRYLVEEKRSLEEVVSLLSTEARQLSLSEKYERGTRDLSLNHKTILESLNGESSGTIYSSVLARKAKIASQIFCLEEKREERPPLLSRTRR